MKILVIADKESKFYWDFYEQGKLDGIDLIISAGDLDPHYLSFLATFAHCPILYVHGNHDDKYDKIPPDGCISIEDTIYVHDGVRILGLGGSLRYKIGTYQYEQREMRSRVRKLWLKLKLNKGFDILVTHAPAMGINDGDDRCHKGFEVFRTLIEKYKPRYFVHGHVHQSYGRKHKRLGICDETLVINAYETYIFEFENEYENQFEKTVEAEKKERELEEKYKKESEDRKREVAERENLKANQTSTESAT